MNTSDSKTSDQKPCLSDVDLLTIIDAIPIGVSVIAPDGTILYVNRRGCDRLRVTLDQVKGKAYLERMLHPDDWLGYSKNVAQGCRREIRSSWKCAC